tara:strand:+ start:495 stop:764 length:270 start_codon:yes stop_codon:yes gene_type:complete
MNKELQQDIGTAAVAFTENQKKSIAAGEHNFLEYWLGAETELLATFQDVFMRHKNKHTFKEMIFFSLLIGKAVKDIMDDLHNFDESSEE